MNWFLYDGDLRHERGEQYGEMGILTEQIQQFLWKAFLK